MNKTDKIALVGDNEAGQTALFKVLNEELTPDSGFIFLVVSPMIFLPCINFEALRQYFS